MRRIPMHMQDWINKLDAFLNINDREILTHADRISHDMARQLAESEYDRFNRRRIGDQDEGGNAFDAMIERLPKGKKKPNTRPQQADTYTHSQEAVQRPDVGVQPEFTERKGAKTYRYDSSLAPELCWDENAEREMAEWLLKRIAEAAEQGEKAVFAEPRRWQGTDETFASIAECVARLKSLTGPFLNWTGKAERREIAVPTIPLFVHERHSTQAILETLGSYKALGTNLDLFGDPELDIADKLDAYEHKGPWTNRLILGCPSSEFFGMLRRFRNGGSGSVSV